MVEKSWFVETVTRLDLNPSQTPADFRARAAIRAKRFRQYLYGWSKFSRSGQPDSLAGNDTTNRNKLQQLLSSRLT